MTKIQGKMRQDLYAELFEVEDKHWWHQHKRKVVHQLIDKYAAKGKALDVGAGTGKMLAELKHKCWQGVGIDFEKEAVKWSKKRGIKLHLVNLQTNRLPFKTGSFDLVLALDVIEHLDRPLPVIKEIKRLLKPKGVLIITVPAYQWLYSYWDKMLGHKCRYDKKRVKKLFQSAGLKISYLGYMSMFWLGPAILVRLIKRGSKKQTVSDFQTTPLAFISLPLIKLLSMIERWLLKYIKLPGGLSVLCVAGKK